MLPVKYNMYFSTEQLLIISLCTFKAETDWRVRPFLSVHINFNYLDLFFYCSYSVGTDCNSICELTQ